MERAVIVHQLTVEEWVTREDPPVQKEIILRALERMKEIRDTLPKENVIIVEEPASTGFTSLPGKVGICNSARLLGARAAYCLRIAREVLEESGIKVILDQEGALP